MDVLLAGESWHEVTMEVKARDVTTSSTYTEAGEYLIAALEATGADVTYQPSHVAAQEFPSTQSELDKFDVVILSDIGSRSLLLTPAVAAGKPEPNRLQVLAEYVADGGAVGMIGGYMSYAGEQGQAGYDKTPLADVLPVEIAHHDDRIERPAGVHPQNCGIEGLPEEWPAVLGYNRFTADDEADVLATVDNDPLLVVGNYGEGSAFAFATDCAEHWAPKPFLEWSYLPDMWSAVLTRIE
ncbi:glutamine amidotransferase [Halorubrum rubrum]|uniref:Glutamine amidotransferase n=1 Tax=Halorubrum rubrum TaxID=1126240 RepID=A0ABD5QZG1_9EURY|nr:glutamine amidotransferase [Halorubrum rubrum]